MCMNRTYYSIDMVCSTSGIPAEPSDEIKIVDDENNEVARGQVGELLYRGASIMTGYYKSEKENKFISYQ